MGGFYLLSRQYTGRVVLVSGGSSGIGACTAQAFAARGDCVYEISRHNAHIPGVRHLTADVTQERQVQQAVASIVDEQGGVDVLVCCAGCGISGALEFTPCRQAQRLMQVNVFGMDACVRAVLPHMRARGNGRIVLVSSVAAVTPIAFQGWYSVSKAAINAYTLALDAEVRPFGVRVCAVMPGDVRTGFTQAREKLHMGDDIYAGRITRSVCRMERDEQNGMVPQRIARAIVRLSCVRRPRRLSSVGVQYRFFCLCAKLLPTDAAAAIVAHLYARSAIFSM